MHALCKSRCAIGARYCPKSRGRILTLDLPSALHRCDLVWQDSLLRGSTPWLLRHRRGVAVPASCSEWIDSLLSGYQRGLLKSKGAEIWKLFV